MKILTQLPWRNREGTATVVVLVLLSMVLLYLSINAHSISNLQRELKVVEKQQIKRLQTRGSVTNATPVVGGVSR